MSNLKLPNLSYSNLQEILSTKSRVRIAYATEVMRAYVGKQESMVLLHHDNIIASMPDADTLYIDNHGWHSRTTAQRIDRILMDNGFGPQVRVGIRQGEMATLDGYDLSIQHKGFRTVTAKRNGITTTVETKA